MRALLASTAVLAPVAALVGCARPAAAPRRPPVPERFADLRAPADRDRFEFPPEVATEVPPPDPTRPLAGDPAVVARLEVLAPPRERFVLRATLPVPEAFPEPVPGRPLLGVVDRWGGGAVVPAQVGVVARRATGEPSVVEVAASVTGTDGDTSVRARFAVVRADEAPDEGLDRPPLLAALLDDPHGAVRLRTRDVFGNRYEAVLTPATGGPGLAGADDLARGPALERTRVCSVLVPVERSGEGEPLPHLMGVHAYWTILAGSERAALDLRVHNGLTSGGAEDTPLTSPVGVVYWDALDLVLPAGWSARPLVEDPALGLARREGDAVVLPLVVQEGGALHAMGPQAQMLRRLTVAPEDQDRGGPAQLAGLGFCVAGEGLWSWWTAATPEWFPQRARLADWSAYRRGGLRGRAALRARLAGERNGLRSTLESGRPQGGVPAGNRMGWAHPLGVAYQGMTGGWGIVLYEGHRVAAAADVAGVEALMLEERMTACRQPEAMWDAAGRVVGAEAWLDGRGRVPFDFRTHNRVGVPEFAFPCRGGPAPSVHVDTVLRRRLRPDYDRGTAWRADGEIDAGDANLLGWMPHDGQHLSRVTRISKALVWLANDPLARDELRMTAELFHLMHHGYPHVPASWSEGITLRVLEQTVDAHPHQGLTFGRDQAWGIDAMCAAYAVLEPDWRERRWDWFQRMGNLVVTAAMPNGLLQRYSHPRIMEGRYAGSQAFECCLLIHAQAALIESVFRGTDDGLRVALEDVVLRGTEYLVFGPVFDCVEDRGVRQCGPRWQFAVAPGKGYGEPPFSDAERWGPDHLPPDGLWGAVETLYVLGSLHYAARYSDPAEGHGLENRYLTRALECGVPSQSYAALLRDFFTRAERDSSDWSGAWEGLAGTLQELGVGLR